MKRFGKQERLNLNEVLRSEVLTCTSPRAKFTPLFEAAFAKRFGVKYAVAMNSASSVLHSALIAAGVGAGDEVLVDPISRFAAAAVLCQNAVPVFADVRRTTFNMDPASLDRRITKRTKAVICTHLFGLPCEMDAIAAIARRHKLVLIEDCALSLRSKYKGQWVGTIGDIGVFSFAAGKQLTLGDGGMALTNDRKLRDGLLRSRLHGFIKGREKEMGGYLGWNYRITELQSAVGLAQTDKMDAMIARHIAAAGLFDLAIRAGKCLVPRPAPADVTDSAQSYAFLFDDAACGKTIRSFKNDMQGACVSVGSYEKPIYLHPLISGMKMYGNRGCPLSCRYYGGRIRYAEGLCPNAEYVAPRMCVIGITSLLNNYTQREIIGLAGKIKARIGERNINAPGRHLLRDDGSQSGIR